MKLHSKFKEIAVFSLCLLVLLLPPVFQTSSNENRFTEWNFPINSLLLAIVAVLLLLFLKGSLNKKIKDESVTEISEKKTAQKLFLILYKAGRIFLTYGILLTTSTIIQIAAAFFKMNDQNNTKVMLPSDFLGFVFCMMTFVFSAFYEEAVYRKYIQEALYSITQAAGKKSVFLIEAFAAVIFSAAHLYLGFFAVLNAFAAHFVLRRTAIKTGGIFSGTVSHFLYNLTILLLICLC